MLPARHGASMKYLRTASRGEHFRLLLELDRNLIDNPELWGIYDSHPLSQIKASDPLVQSKRNAFIYLHFNLFEMVHDFYHHVISRMDKIDIMYWHEWYRYIYQFFRESSKARIIFKSSIAGRYILKVFYPL